MSYCRRVTVEVTTASDGSATKYTDAVNGRVLSCHYTKDATTPFADTADFTITSESLGQGIWTESNVTASKAVAPRQPTHDTSAAASLYAAGGEPVEAPIWLADERIKIVIAQGGDTKLGTFTFVIG